MHRVISTQATHALKVLRRVEANAWVWADSVRACIEERMGTGPDDLRVLDDPVYGEALDHCAELRRITEQAEQVLRHLQAAQAIEFQHEAER